MRVHSFPRLAGVAALAGLLASAACSGSKQPSPQRSVEEETSYKVRLARSQMNAGRIGEALDTVREAIALDPDSPGLYNFYGQIFLIAGRHEEAETALRKALALDPYMTDAHNNLGTVYLELSRTAEAEREFNLALEDPVYPTPEKVHLNLGLLYASQGRDREAIEALRKAVEIDTKYYRAHYELASILERTGLSEEAVREYEVAEPGYRGSGEYWYRRGMAYFRVGDRLKASESLHRTLSVAPGSPSAARADELLRSMD
jgi:type IV pilus assembly protein PilF